MVGVGAARILKVAGATGVPAWVGYSAPSLGSTPWWVIAMAVAPALLLFAAPFLVTVHFSRKAVAEGGQAGRLPLAVAAVVVGGFVATNLVAGLAQLVLR